jgi:ribosomal protein S18 acetylase RimI-like enzyme
MTDSEILRRITEYGDRLDRAIAERIEPVAEGITAFLDTRIPRIWDANYLVIEPGVTAKTAAAVADEVLGGLGMTHRAVSPAVQESAAELEPGFRQLGWEVEHGVQMVLRRDPDRAAGIEVEQMSIDEVQDLRGQLIGEMEHADPETVEQLLELERYVNQAVSDRWFAARHDGELAGCCRLLQADGIGQVEDVATLTAARNNGLARAVVLAAARTSVDDGDEITFIGAVADDWPRLLYERLGFDTVGEWRHFRLKPPPGH